jgi:Xaa-Pro aminopeptidase
VTPPDESARAAQLLAAQDRAIELFEAVDALGVVRGGMLESEATADIFALAADRFGVQRHWHKRIIRSGPNTLEPYDRNPPDRRIAADDIVFADFGPVFDGWEADLGRTWVLGTDADADADSDKARLRDDLPIVFDLGRRHFEANGQITGAQLYAHVAGLAEERGWTFGNVHCGHLVGEFPHERFDGPKVESMITAANSLPMRRHDAHGRVGHWILEIHLVDRAREIGGFYEQLLTV